MEARLIAIICVPAVLLSGCIDFESIDQPYCLHGNEIFTVYIETSTSGGDYSPYFGVCIPTGWSVPGDSIQCTGVYNETIYYDSSVSSGQESVSPAPQGYYWWAGSGAGVNTPERIVHGELHIQTDGQLGCFSLDYMLGNDYYGVNQNRSDDHLIWIVNDFTPTSLQAFENQSSVFLNWNSPFNYD